MNWFFMMFIFCTIEKKMSHFVETGIDVLSAVAEILNRYKICIESQYLPMQISVSSVMKFLLGWIKISVSKLASIFWKKKKTKPLTLSETISNIFYATIFISAAQKMTYWRNTNLRMRQKHLWTQNLLWFQPQ